MFARIEVLSKKGFAVAMLRLWLGGPVRSRMLKTRSNHSSKLNGAGVGMRTNDLLFPNSYYYYVTFYRTDDNGALRVRKHPM